MSGAGLDLADFLRSVQEADTADGELIVVTPDGKPWAVRRVGYDFRAVCGCRRVFLLVQEAAGSGRAEGGTNG